MNDTENKLFLNLSFKTQQGICFDTRTINRIFWMKASNSKQVKNPEFLRRKLLSTTASEMHVAPLIWSSGTFTLQHSHNFTLSHPHTSTLSCSHTLTLSHFHTLTLSHFQTLTLTPSHFHSHTNTLTHSHTFTI